MHYLLFAPLNKLWHLCISLESTTLVCMGVISHNEFVTNHLNRLPRILTTASLSKNLLRINTQSGKLVRLMPGCYVEAEKLPDPRAPLYRQAQERAKIQLAAGITGLREGEALSHWSAGIAWGLPWYGTDTRVHILRGSSNRHPRSGVALHSSSREPYLVTSLDGITVTDLEQTAIHLAAVSHPAIGLAYIDYARRIGASTEGFRTVSEGLLGRGRTRVEQLIELSVKNSESPKESECRYWLYKAGAREVITQVKVCTELGDFRADMQIKGTPLLYEYDGEEKYDTDSTSLYNEKEREDAIRALGFVVVRVTKRHLRNPERFMFDVRKRLTALGYELLPPSQVKAP